MEVQGWADNPFNHTYILNSAEFKFVVKEGRVQEKPTAGPYFLRQFWGQAAKIRGLLDLAGEVGDQKTRSPFQKLSNPREFRESGKGVYFSLLEQALVAIVSAWEAFFRGTITYVLNRPLFIMRALSREDEPLRVIAREYRVADEMLLELVLRQTDLKRMHLGDVVAAGQRIRWQSLEDCKRIVKILFPDLDLASKAREWGKTALLFQNRHKIVHESGEETRLVDDVDFDKEGEPFPVKVETAYAVVRDYDPKRIEKVLDDTLRVAEAVHNRLFSSYTPDESEY